MLSDDAQNALIDSYADRRGMRKVAFPTGMLEGIQGLDVEVDRDEHAAAIYVDIAGFSRRIDGWDAASVRAYLDDYYDRALPIIKNGGGRVDRVAGDGIIAIFCPFLGTGFRTEEDAETGAHTTARAVVKSLYGTEFAAKAALSSGRLLFCKTGLEAIYEEYTVIGQPMTELYRVEEVASVNELAHRADARMGRAVIQSVNAEERRRRLGLINPISKPYWQVGPDGHPTPLRGVNNGQPVTLLREKFFA